MVDKKSYRHEYYLKNKEKINKHNMEYRDKNRDYLNMKQREYYHKNKGILLAKRKIRYDTIENVKICNICGLEYPKKEMRGEICYLCKIESAKAGITKT